MATNNKGMQGGTENFAPMHKGIAVDGNIYEPLNPGGGNLLAEPIFDFTTEWVAKVQPTPKGLSAVWSGLTYEIAKAKYGLRAGLKNGVFQGTSISGRPVAVNGSPDVNKAIVPTVGRWRIIPVVGASMRVLGDKPSLYIGREAPTSEADLEAGFSLSKGRINVCTQATDDIIAGAGSNIPFDIPAYATHAEIVGFGAISDFYYRDPINHDFMVGFGAVKGINTRFALHPLALTLVVASTGVAQYYIEFTTLE